MLGWELFDTSTGIAIRYFLIVWMWKYWFLIALDECAKERR
jgi:hypothetical protein